MKRKLIAQGNNSYTLTLPVKWIREKSLEGGDDLELRVLDEGILISSSLKKQKKTTEINIEGFDERTLRIVLNQEYRTGFDEIILIGDTKYKDFIDRFVSSRLLGFEITNYAKNKIIIQNIAEPQVDNFGAILRKVFLIVKESFSLDNNTALLNDKMNSYCNFCQRLIYAHSLGGKKHSILLILMVTRLLVIQHALMRTSKNHDFKNIVKERFDDLYDTFYDFNMDKVVKNHDVCSKNLFVDFQQVLLKSKKDENLILYQLGEALRNIYLCFVNLFVFGDFDRKLLK